MSSSPEQQKYPYGYGLSKITLVKLHMNRANVQRWSLILGLAPFLLMYLWSLFREYILTTESYQFLDSFIFALGLLIWGFLGLFWAYRRQVPQLVTIKGKAAFILGMLMMIVSWSISLYSIVYGLRLLIENLQ